MSDAVGPGRSQEFAFLTGSQVRLKLLVEGPLKVLEGSCLRKRVKKVDLLRLDKRSQSLDLVRAFNN